jgi:SAM-dependent MidA family methyltransferase
MPSPFLAQASSPTPPPPPWLLERLQAAGGSVPFRTYMDWALHDPVHGYYGSGRARIGAAGDFATSPSMGEEFAALLLPQLIEWLDQLSGTRLSLLEIGPGEGQLAGQLATGLVHRRPDLAARVELVLVEPNPGMAAIQRQALQSSPLPVRWTEWTELARAPLHGVAIAHEVLDALPVDRLLWDGGSWRWQHVALRDGQLALVSGPDLQLEERERIVAFDPLVPGRPAGWCTELHPALEPWFAQCAAALRAGLLLVVDYALEARRYYAPSRANGTLMAYRGQTASLNPLLEPGTWDLTAHLCLESLRSAAAAAGWHGLGERKQGECLLALGLAHRLAALSQTVDLPLSQCLRRKEQLLRLVDPLATGDFRWLVFARTGAGAMTGAIRSRCLCDPPLEDGEPSAKGESGTASQSATPGL